MSDLPFAECLVEQRYSDPTKKNIKWEDPTLVQGWLQAQGVHENKKKRGGGVSICVCLTTNYKKREIDKTPSVVREFVSVQWLLLMMRLVVVVSFQ